MRDSLERGENVVLRLPQGAPEGIDRAISAQLEWLNWETIDARRTEDPIKVLFEAYVHDPQASLRRTPSELVRQETFQGFALWLSGIDADSWPRWRKFLMEYQHAMRDIREVERSVFIVPLTGREALLAADNEVGIVEHAWGKNHDRHDALFLAKMLLERRRFAPLHRRVAIASLAELALWDSDLAERLASDGQHVLTDPHAILDELRAERGWSSGTDAELEGDELWATGQAAVVDGQLVRHLAAFPPEERRRETARRVWRAQVATCMPIIEEIRFGAISTYGSYLEPEVTSGATRREAVFDLEIAEVARQLKTRSEVPIEHRRLLNRLHRARNRLAHLETVEWDDIPNHFPDGLGVGARQ